VRAIDVSDFGMITPPRDRGPAPELRWLPIEQLVIDEGYQRRITEQGRKNVRRIAEAFSWAFFAPVIVSPIEGGRYAIIDGQHRTTAAALIGVKEVPCALVIADAQRQAAAFRAINANVTRLLKTQLYHAKLAAGDETARTAQAMCEAGGVVIPRTPSNWAEKLTHCIAVQAIERMARNHYRAGVLTLKALRAASIASEVTCLRAPAIDALFDVLVDAPQWREDENALIAAVADLPIDEMLADAKAAATRVKGASARDRLAAALVDAFGRAFQKAA
jgi:hypothetical protein